MAEPAPFAIPLDAELRIDRVALLTGTPASTLRREIMEGRLAGWRKLRNYYTSLRAHNAWVESERGRDDRAAAVGQVSLRVASGGAEGEGEGPEHEGPSSPKPKRQARKRKRRRVPIVYDIRPDVAEAEG